MNIELQNVELSARERGQLLRYYLGPIIAWPCVAAAVAVTVLWGILVMIGDLAFCAHSFYDIGFGVCMGFVILLMVVFCVGILVPKFGMRGKRWKALCDKAKIHGAPEYVAQACGVELPNPTWMVVSVIAVPLLVLVATFIPAYMQYGDEMSQRATIAAETIDELTAVFPEDAFEIHLSEDPHEGYSDSGYYLYVDLANENGDSDANEGSDLRSYLSIYVNYKGEVEDISCYIDVDPSQTKASIKKHLIDDAATFSAALADVKGVDSQQLRLMAKAKFTKKFWEEFTQTSNYEKVSVSEKLEDGSKVYCFYQAVSEEDAASGSVPYASLSCKEA